MSFSPRFDQPSPTFVKNLSILINKSWSSSVLDLSPSKLDSTTSLDSDKHGKSLSGLEHSKLELVPVDSENQQNSQPPVISIPIVVTSDKNQKKLYKPPFIQ